MSRYFNIVLLSVCQRLSALCIERHVVKLEKQLRMEDQHGFFKNIKSVQLEKTKKVASQCVRNEEGRLLRDKGRIRAWWVRFFRSLLNAKSDMLDLDIPKRLLEHSVASSLGMEPREEEIPTLYTDSIDLHRENSRVVDRRCLLAVRL